MISYQLIMDTIIVNFYIISISLCIISIMRILYRHEKLYNFNIISPVLINHIAIAAYRTSAIALYDCFVINENNFISLTGF